MIKFLQTKEGVYLLASDRNLGLLTTYCAEHMKAELFHDATIKNETVSVRTVQSVLADA